MKREVISQHFSICLMITNYRRWFQLCAVILIISGSFLQGQAQNNFVSGSTGADGAFAPTANQTVTLPESGVLNYTTVNIPSGVTIKFAPNSRNTPVIILASGNVAIAGTIDINGENGLPTYFGGRGGPGGFRGGRGGFNIDNFNGGNGDGRGGGSGGGSSNGTTYSGGGGGGHALVGTRGGYSTATALDGAGGVRYGTSALQPLSGGSGGGGGGSKSNKRGEGGGGGGGAILIASSGTINFTGIITAKGGTGGQAYFNGGGGGGAGGAVRLIANTITGSGNINVNGGNGSTLYSIESPPGGNGGKGYVRAEAYDFTAFNPALNEAAVSMSAPNSVFPPSNIQLKITSVAGVAAPAVATGSMMGPFDMVLPGNLSNPVEVVLQAAQVPVGSVIEVMVQPELAARTVYQSTPLSGTLENSSATASITLPRGANLITASLVVDLTASNLQPMFIEGERIKQIEVAAMYGRQPQNVYVTVSGKRFVQ